MEKPQYIDWIVEETGIVIKDDIPLKCYKIDYKDDESILDDWALHIRRNYIEDTELKEDADDNAMTVEQYLHDYVIPQKGEELGATVRSADITEILISDLLEFVHQYSVPRYKLKNRSGKNNSQQGTDVIAYKYKNEDKTPNDKDELVAAEVKATLSNMEYTPIKNAIIDSRKDEHRLARSVNYCRNIYNYLLGGVYLPYLRVIDTYERINNFFLDYFGKGKSLEALKSNLWVYRNEIYENGDPDSIFYVDILVAVIIVACENSSWSLLPSSSGILDEEWESYLQSKMSIKMLWPAQRLIAEKGLLRGESSIVQLPTGVGKTRSIELIIRAAFLSERANIAIIVAPLRALCNEITMDMYKAFGNDVTINQFSDVLQNDFWNLFSEDIKRQILICTPEKLSYVLHHDPFFLSAIDLFVFDEGHMFDDGGRGATYELLVTHIRQNKYVSCVVCTSTLAQGVNIPIKYLLVTSIRNGLKLVKARDFQNLMGRTARAGIYTEGSIIITDCKIYDNRTNWKNGGRYLWNDCVKLFDTKLTEPCGSSILSLVQDFNIDYDVTVSGEKFIDIVIDHLDERDFLLDYAKKLEKAYLKVNPKRTQNLIVQEILLRQDIISNIENYLCLVRSAETLVNDSKKSAVDICTNTLAYAMATEKEKELLIKVFQKIEENIQQYSVEKLSRYSNAMSGIGLSSLIEEWIVQNELTEKIYTETELLYVITELYLQICGDFRYQEHIQSICKKWIDGQTPMEINNKETIGIAEVESLCNKRISYEMNFLIGNICDLIEVDGENEEQVDQRNILTLLQKKVKYGVPNMTAISICESVFNDRLLAIELAQILSDANIGTDKILNMLKAHSEEIFSCLDSYPEYFKDRLSVLMK